MLQEPLNDWKWLMQATRFMLLNTSIIRGETFKKEYENIQAYTIVNNIIQYHVIACIIKSVYRYTCISKIDIFLNVQSYKSAVCSLQS
jgi:hypothetical protein